MPLAQTAVSASWSDLDTLLASASFHCQIIADGPVVKRWVPNAHRIPCDKLYVVWSGTGVARLNYNDYKIKAGDVFLIPAGTIQQGDTDAVDPLNKAWAHFESFTTSRLELLSLYPPPLCLRGKTSETIAVLMREMLEEAASSRPARQLAMNSLLMRILLAAYRAPKEDERPPDQVRKKSMLAEEPGSRLPIDRIRLVLAMLNQHIAKPLQLSDLAKTACLHPTYFTQVFKQLVGMPPMKFLEQQRIQRAQELLGRTEETVSDIAHTCGYPDPYHFSRVFKKVTGQNPSQFRDHARAHHAS